MIHSHAVAELRELIADPSPRARAAGPASRANDDALRVTLVLIDAMQVMLVGLLTRHAFPPVAAEIGTGQTLGLALIAAVLATTLRRAMRPAGEQDWLRPPHAAAARALAATCIALGALAVVILLSRPEAAPQAAEWVLLWAFVSGGISAGLRRGTAALAGRIDGAVPRMAIVGTTAETEPLVQALARDVREDWRFAGRFDDASDDDIARLMRLVQAGEVQVVALAMPGCDAARIAALRERLLDQPVLLCLAFDGSALAWTPRRTALRLMDIAGTPHRGGAGVAKRGLDLLVGAAALVALSPVLLAAAVAVKLTSPGPVLFRQWRFGAGSRPIEVLKFRTMRTDSCDVTGAQRTVARDPRVTPVGRFLRRSSIDELPQLINVLRGEMSLVGPRAHPMHMRVEGDYYFEAVANYRARHLVRPGITGWAQVNGSRGEVDTLEKARRRVALDLWYIENWSLALDLRILLRTALGGFASTKAD
ncbi:exopolysaccharide biosynthesis polyprenyl glycosylphosphotransferase [Falsiroseomonas sp. HW251]|uniref:exopolysaccharide biosynthesis polyprenyl glycosylphosphotransferase n=1 Tax=Falsiroseomonas sp. HW251 TaxID=3390998 RepID=UPI003D31F754